MSINKSPNHKIHSPKIQKAGNVLTVASLILGLGIPSMSFSSDWASAWYASPQPRFLPSFIESNPVPKSISNQTIRQIVRLNLDGSKIRVAISNEYGIQPLTVGVASVASLDADGLITPKSNQELTFGGDTEVRIPQGSKVISDPIKRDVSAFDKLAISMYFPKEVMLDTFHHLGRETTYLSGMGNFVNKASFKAKASFPSWVLLSDVLVDAPEDAKTVVLFGDSITDGYNSSLGMNRRYPDFLAERFHAEGYSNFSVVNAGISGAQLMNAEAGESALARLDSQVLTQPNVKIMVLLMGINDLGFAESLDPWRSVPSSQDLIKMYQMIIDRAHLQDIRIFGATLTPFKHAFKGINNLEGYYSDEKNKAREEVNEWTRTSGAFDGIIDFDKVIRDPARVDYMLDKYNSGDNLHPNDLGYKAMADAIDLKLLLRK
jgi:lysophospholipase L1-like esterase